MPIENRFRRFLAYMWYGLVCVVFIPYSSLAQYFY